jgi:hypothetical protein
MIGCNSCTEDIALIPGFGGGFVHIREGEGEEGKKRKEKEEGIPRVKFHAQHGFSLGSQMLMENFLVQIDCRELNRGK